MTGPVGERADHDVARLELTSASRATDSGYLALADLAEIAGSLGVEYRIVGGHMVTLLVAAYGLADHVAGRETMDADFGAMPEVVGDPQPHGNLFVDEIPGLASALNHPPLQADVRVDLTSGAQVSMRLMLPDVVSALCIKAMAYSGRFADKDAVDLWRLVNAAHAAGVDPGVWAAGVTRPGAARVLRTYFGRPSSTGLKQMSRDRTDQARMRVLVRAVLGPPTSG